MLLGNRLMSVTRSSVFGQSFWAADHGSKSERFVLFVHKLNKQLRLTMRVTVQDVNVMARNVRMSPRAVSVSRM